MRLIDAEYRLHDLPCYYDFSDEDLMAISEALKLIPTADAVPVPDGGIGELSDGYHTFNGLYYQRMMLFATLVKTYKERAWKSHRHSDGELCFGGGWFIVGIDTPQGGYTYHYEDKYFDLFDCVELLNGKEWDGHTEDDVTRLLTLDVVQVVLCKDCRYFHENVFGDEIGMGRPYDCLIVGHCCCEFWGRKNDCSMSQTSPEGFCSFGERRSNDADND